MEQIKVLANQYPDTLYGRLDKFCSYKNGKAGPGSGCIVGQAIKEVAPDIYEMMVQFEDESDNSFEYQAVGNYYKINSIQMKQDRNETWGEMCRRSIRESTL